MKRVLTIFGTRPEAIKLAPLVQLLAEQPDLDSKVCVTAQHREMLDQVLDVFSIQSDFDLDLMRPNQSLAEISANTLRNVDQVLHSYLPDLVIVQGDTATTLAAAQAAFYRQIPVFHVEAGLRTGNLASPWPEEGNRKMVSAIASRHFVATEGAAENLMQEGVPSTKILQTGNTVVDALYAVQDLIAANSNVSASLRERFGFLRSNHRLVLVTAHRRENFGIGLQNITEAIAQLALDLPDIDFVFPVHPNPQVSEPVQQKLASLNNVYLIKPLGYSEFVYLMGISTLILTDSGGVQEEAPALGKPVLLMRNHTERPEAINAGAVSIVGTDPKAIQKTIHDLLHDDATYQAMAQVRHIFGDGQACQRIVQAIREFLEVEALEGLVDA